MVILSALATLAATAGIEKASEKIIEEFFEFYKKSYVKQFKSDEMEDLLREYMSISLKKNLYINSVAFRNQDKTLLDLYYPLVLQAGAKIRSTGKTYFEYSMDDNCLGLFDYLKRIMIVDHAGMGKSTLSKYIFTLCVSSHRYIPIIIELRNLTEKYSLWDELFHQFDLMDRHLEIDDIKSQLKTGGFFLIFDGFDEVRNSDKKYIAESIIDLVYKADKNCYILTSRPDPFLKVFGDSNFFRYQIRPLSNEDAYALLSRVGNNDECSQRLIQIIKNDNKTIKEFTSNPLLLSLLYRSFSYNGSIPELKKDFYQQVFVALFRDHDTTKGFERKKHSGLSLDQFDSVLRGLGWICFDQEKVEFDRCSLLNCIQEAIDTAVCNNVSREHFLEDLLHTVPLFEEIGNDRYKWCHKSFVEYFAAKCICEDFNEEERKEMLEEFADHMQRYYNILDFCTEIDYKDCRDYIYIPFLEELLSQKPEDEKEHIDCLYNLGYGNDTYVNFSGLCIISYLENKGYMLYTSPDFEYYRNHCEIVVSKFKLEKIEFESCILPKSLRKTIYELGPTFRDKEAYSEIVNSEFFAPQIITPDDVIQHHVLTFETIEDVLNKLIYERDNYRKGRFGIKRRKK